MRDDNRKYKIVLLTILTLSVITLTVVECYKYFHNRNGEGPGYFYTKDNNTIVYRGEIVPEQVKTRSETVAEMPKTTMQFYESKYDFGVLPEGQIVKHAFRFRNTGRNPLMISKTDVTCGCTVPEFPIESISPGSDGEITVVYNTSGKSGPQEKTIIVHSNALPEGITITIVAYIQ